MPSSKPKFNVLPRIEMVGLNYGIQFNDNDEVVFVSPAIYSLFKSDKDAVMDSLVVRIIKKSDPDNILKKKNLTVLKSCRKKGVGQNGSKSGLLSNMFNHVNKRRGLPEL